MKDFLQLIALTVGIVALGVVGIAFIALLALAAASPLILIVWLIVQAL